MRVSVDPDACCLYAQCVSTAPAVFWIEEETLVWDVSPPLESLPLVESAVAGCPAQAISLTDDSAGPP